MFYQQSPGYYYSSQIGSSYRSYDAAVCGVYGNGKLVTGFNTSSYSANDREPPLLYSAGSSSYSSSSWKAAVLAPGFQIKQIVHQNGKFVAVGARFESAYPYHSKGAILISPDGVEWITLAINNTTYLEAVCHDGTRWVAVGKSGVVLTSSNGFEWTRTTIPGGETLTSVAAGNGYCVVGSANGKIHTTTDFVSWNFQHAVSGSVSSLAVGDGKFMALIGKRIYKAAFSPVGVADIVSQPFSGFVVPQQSVVLSVGSAGSGSLEYQWYEGASGNTSFPVPGATAASYQTPPLTGDAIYWVRVSNALGQEDSATAVLTMQYPPVITSQPANKQLEAGQDVSTSVVVTGNNISYQWFRGFSGDLSSPLAGATSASLTIPSGVAGVSYYWLRAGNERGVVHSVAMRAEVHMVPPRITGEPLDKTIFAGDYSPIRVYAEGSLLSYQWYAGASGDTSRPVPETYSSFSPPYDVPGTYRFWVRVSNSHGFVDSRAASFMVLPSLKPVITRQPLDTVAYQGVGKSIYISASGDDLDYAWYGGESGDTSALLEDYGSSFNPSVAAVGVYRYWVRVSNASGFVDSEAVNYLVKPQGTGLITSHPVDATVELGYSNSLTVTAAGSSLSYQWYVGVSGDDSNPVDGKTSSYFYPEDSEVGQTSYWVRVTSGSTVEDSETAVVKVIPRILVITDPPLDRVTFVGDGIYYYVYTQGS
ncbi:MAG: hypothetical protein EOP88_15905, partial [Verrucomicrobiaceae bacterium]